ncbi:MAG: hypothetical protein AB1485_00180 [Candidatus Thermoplasmatota archaeon]
MAKTISVNEYVYAQIASLTGEITMLAKKPFAMGATILLGMLLLRKWLAEPGGKEAAKEAFSKAEILSPEEFDRQWEALFAKIGAK